MGDAVCPAPVPWSNSTNAASLACPSFNIHNSGLTEDTQRCIWLLESPGSWTEPCVQVGKSLPITSSLLLLPRRQQPIPKLNPPPPILRKRSSKTSPSLEVDIKPESTAHVSLPSPSVSGLTSITATSLTLLDPEARTPARSAAANAEPLSVGTYQHVLSKDRSGENGHTSPPSSIHDPTASDALSKDLASLLSPTDSTLPFSPADDTCLHISFSEDELLEPELDTTVGPSRVPS